MIVYVYVAIGLILGNILGNLLTWVLPIFGISGNLALLIGVVLWTVIVVLSLILGLVAQYK